MILILPENNNPDITLSVPRLQSAGYRTCMFNTSQGSVCTILNADSSGVERLRLLDLNASPAPQDVPYILASRNIKDTGTEIDVGHGVTIGGSDLCVIAGPCSIESETQIMEAAETVKISGASILRGGAYKPRSSPYAFQGMGLDGLRLLRKAGDSFSLPIITEVLDQDDIPVVEEYSDIIQIGARNCQNFSLLKKVGRTKKPVLLKRGMMLTIEEFLLSAEYLLSEGNLNVILCERGIRTFVTETRNTLDISAVPVLKQRTHLPVIVDPSHAAGTWKLIHPLSLAAVAVGADGLMVEMHPHPESALCDGKQSLRPDRFIALMGMIGPMANLVGRSIQGRRHTETSATVGPVST
ncbi:MAG TPA: 3-deoxy-7-phosphoheptulonate synthase [Spirochaetota bacterium]|nr:3-deoxy-7-phosphoheptulonate synthase [Spirochaetota bacterium]